MLPGWVWGRLNEFLELLSRGSRAALIIQVAGAVLDYLVHMLLARWLGPAEFGRYSFHLGCCQLLVRAKGREADLSAVAALSEQSGAKADVAQLAERVLGKDEVTSSILVIGSTLRSRRPPSA